MNSSSRRRAASCWPARNSTQARWPTHIPPMPTGEKKVSCSREDRIAAGQSPREYPAKPRAQGAKYSWAASRIGISSGSVTTGRYAQPTRHAAE
jgi:hypothetical protein